MDKTITIKGNQLTYTTEGDPQNPAIIMLHDWASYRGVWQQTIATLSSKYYCIAVDFLGFGASDKPEKVDYSLTAQAQRILSLADKMGLQSFSLIGHSMGGQVALMIASLIAPQRVEKLIVVNSIVTGKFSRTFEKYVPGIVSTFRKMPFLYNFSNNFINMPYFGKSFFKPWFYNVDQLPFESWKNDRSEALNRACYISLPESLNAIYSMDLTQHLRKIKAQTLIISARQDGMIPQDQSLLAQTLIPNNDLALLEKCGHFPMYEKPGNYLKALAIILK